MKQLAQKLSDGKQVVIDVPEPILEPGQILVRVRYSAISPGTEGATVRSARKNIVAKALERPKDVKAVLELARRQGITQAYRAVSKKLDAYSPLGYSCSGIVIEAGADTRGFAPGDSVACAGVGYANHAEVVAVPSNLCVKLEPDADLKYAAYNTLGAIALQGVRQADLRLGETCAVIGLGVIGVLTCMALEASGVRTIGIDVDPRAVDAAAKCGIETRRRDDPGLESRALQVSGGAGLDAVIIAAGASSLDPVNFAGRLARRKGRVVVLGAVPTGFDRNPDYYPKELELRMSCSYGPGRYDLNYEEHGLDYPSGYVRWTENRNMQAFQQLIYSGRINLEPLTTRVFSLEDAPVAYDMILARTEPVLGALIEYEQHDDGRRKETLVKLPVSEEKTSARSQIETKGYAFIGAGSYAQGSLLPNMPHDTRLRPYAVVTRSGATSKRVAEKFHFGVCSSDPENIVNTPGVDPIFIATRHNLHAQHVLAALRAGKSVYVEKPLCLTLDEYVEIEREYRAIAEAGGRQLLMIGFNRRFAPLALELKGRLSDAPLALTYRVNAGSLPASSWIQDPAIGGGRVLGEVCHFIDFALWLSGSRPASVYATAMADPSGLGDVLSVQLKTLNGSIASVHYFANGSKEIPKERIEAHQSGQTGILDDFRRLTFCDAQGRKKITKTVQDKGQREMLRRFCNAFLDGEAAPVAPQEIFDSTLATFAALDSIRTRSEISFEE